MFDRSINNHNLVLIEDNKFNQIYDCLNCGSRCVYSRIYVFWAPWELKKKFIKTQEESYDDTCGNIIIRSIIE